MTPVMAQHLGAQLLSVDSCYSIFFFFCCCDKYQREMVEREKIYEVTDHSWLALFAVELW
jgi:hypothetical protein